MASIDSRPEVINIDHYSGDTLTLNVKIASEVVGTREWSAQVRRKTESRRVDASFVVVPNAEGVSLVLENEQCQRLTRHGKYTGYWDVQLAEAGGADPVTTLAHGKLTVHPDVTRTSS